MPDGGAVDTDGLEVATAPVVGAGGVLTTGGFGTQALPAMRTRTLTHWRKDLATAGL